MTSEWPSGNKKVEDIVKKTDEIYSRAERYILEQFWKDFPSLRLYEKEVNHYLNYLPQEKWEKVRQYGYSYLLMDFTESSYGATAQIGNSERLSAEGVEIIHAAADIEFEEGALEMQREREIKSEYLGMRLAFLRVALEKSYDKALAERRNLVATGLVKVYLMEDLPIPPKLRLLISDKDYKKIQDEIAKDSNDPRVGEFAKGIRDGLETRIKEVESTENEMVEKGVHPNIAARRQDVDMDKELSLQSNIFAELQEFKDSRVRQVNEIMSTYDDPRDVCNWLLDSDEVWNLVQKVGKG